MTADPAVSGRMSFEECRQFGVYAHRAQRLFPGAIGDVLAERLFAVAELGFLPGASAASRRLMAALDDEQRRRDQQAAVERAVEVDEAAHGRRNGACVCVCGANGGPVAPTQPPARNAVTERSETRHSEQRQRFAVPRWPLRGTT